jgi:hypothetical protein
MASGHVNRTNRPNTWLHRPSLRREESSCHPGAVHTWHDSDISIGLTQVRSLGRSGSTRRRLLRGADDPLLPLGPQDFRSVKALVVFCSSVVTSTVSNDQHL